MSSPILVTAAIIKKDEKYLITQRVKDAKFLPNLWEFPGGKVEDDEIPETCLEREILEELGIKVKARNLFGRKEHIDGNGLHINLIGFYCDYDPKERIQHIEVQNHCWLFPNEMKNYDFCPADYFIIEKLNRLS